MSDAVTVAGQTTGPHGKRWPWKNACATCSDAMGQTHPTVSPTRSRSTPHPRRWNGGLKHRPMLFADPLLDGSQNRHYWQHSIAFIQRALGMGSSTQAMASHPTDPAGAHPRLQSSGTFQLTQSVPVSSTHRERLRRRIAVRQLRGNLASRPRGTPHRAPLRLASSASKANQSAGWTVRPECWCCVSWLRRCRCAPLCVWHHGRGGAAARASVRL